jgi:hypothetical protein
LVLNRDERGKRTRKDLRSGEGEGHLLIFRG